MKKTGNRIIAILIIIWIIGSFVGFAFAMQSDGLRWLGLVLMGQLLFVAGIAVTVSLIQDKTASAPIGGLFILVGGILLVGGFLSRFGSEETQHALIRLFPAVFGGLFLLVGICGLIAPIVWKKRKEKKYTTPVDAVCIARRQMPRGRHVLTDPVYRITWKENVYELDNCVYRSGFAPEVGETRTLFIDENDIGGYLDPAEAGAERIAGILKSVFFSLFIIVGGIVLILFLSGRL